MAPRDRAKISGHKVVWRASYGGVRPQRIAFLVDGVKRWTDATPPFRFKGKRGHLDTTTLSNGRHRLTIAAYRGGMKVISSIVVTVANKKQSPKLRSSLRSIPPPASNPSAPSTPVVTSPPPTSANLSAISIDYGHIRLSWPAVNGASVYRVYRGGTLIAATSGTTATDAMLWPETTYAYRVDAVSSGATVLGSMTASATTAHLPMSGYPRPFASASVWNTPIGDAGVVSDNAALIAHFEANIPWPNMALHSWAASVAEATPSSSLFEIGCTLYKPCTLGAFGAISVPATAAPDPSADGHMAVYDPVTQRAWGMWQARKQDGAWSASAGEAVSTTGDGIVPAGTFSSNAANFPLIAGLVRPEEILQGHIDHALVFGMPFVSNAGHVCPATHNDGSSGAPGALREGMRLQLDPALDVEALPIPAWKKTIARALQVYGMYLRDEGGSLSIMAENPISRGYDAWAKVGLSGDSVFLTGIPWDRFKVVSAPC